MLERSCRLFLDYEVGQYILAVHVDNGQPSEPFLLLPAFLAAETTGAAYFADLAAVVDNEHEIVVAIFVP